MQQVNLSRIKTSPQASLKNTGETVLYWMSRDQRAEDNWALLYAQEQALAYKLPLLVLFVVQRQLSHANKEHFSFMLDGLRQVHKDLSKKNIPFILATGKPVDEVLSLATLYNATLIVTDMSPLRAARDTRKEIAEASYVPVHVVDAHNIVPVWEASQKQEYAARTIRPKIHQLLPTYLTPFPALKKHPYQYTQKLPTPNWYAAYSYPKVISQHQDLSWITPSKGRKHVQRFISSTLHAYATDRNDPTKDALSGLSPYLHFGQLSAQHVALAVQDADGIAPKNKDAFLEELIIRRELAENYCYYNAHYDSFDGFPDWAQKTLQKHRNDKREYVYTLEQFENAATHDPLWNAAQQQMIRTGKMHGFIRMYWCKKILEWTETPEVAQKIALHLNDTYELDGRDPNGFTGVAWSIGGVHDRPWFEREVFGKVRYMNLNGAKRKFNVSAYIDRWTANHD